MKPRLENYVFPRLHCETASERKKKKKENPPTNQKIKSVFKIAEF